MTDELDDLREQTRGTDRISADTDDAGGEEDNDEPEGGVRDEAEARADDTERRAGPEPSDGFTSEFADRHHRARSGIEPRTFSARDPGLSAFLAALTQTGEIEDVGREICERLGAPEPDEYDHDAFVRLAVTYAVRDAAPDYFEVLADSTE